MCSLCTRSVNHHNALGINRVVTLHLGADGQYHDYYDLYSNCVYVEEQMVQVQNMVTAYLL